LPFPGSDGLLALSDGLLDGLLLTLSDGLLDGLLLIDAEDFPMISHIFSPGP
jgi:hypothetical protein